LTERHTPRRKKVRKLNPVKLSIFIGVFALLFFIGSVLGLVMFSTKDMPAWNPAALQPNLPSYIYDKDGAQVATIFVENRVPVEFEKVPENVRNAFLAIEDVRFYDHNGLDLRRMVGALIADIKSGTKAQGASTITQQLVKRAFLSPDKTLERKIQEAVLSIKLERQFTKPQIFEMYLNRIYFGEGAYGIQSAAQVYFNKNSWELNLEEAALLASLPKAPNTYDPFKNLEAATKRRNLVLDSMVRAKFINAELAEATKEKPVTLSENKAGKSLNYKYPFYVDYITELLIDKYGEDTVYKGGLKVKTALDPKIQEYTEQALANEKNFPKSKDDNNGIIQPQAAAVVLDPYNGYIKAIVGGRNHKQKRQFNRATDAVRQPGSAFKPIADYAPAIEKGKAPADVVLDEPFKDFKNYDGAYHGLVTYRRAILNSYNIPAIKILQDTGVKKSIDFVKKLGITTLVTADINSSKNDENLSLGLGGLTRGVKPLELAAAFGAFANEGVYVQPTAILKVEDRDGNIIDQFKPKKTIAMKKTTAYIMTDMLRSAVTSGTGTGASLGSRPVAGKTGTTSDYKDAWFAGYTPELVAVVWIGHDDPKPMRGITGGSYPARIWRDIMSKSLKNAPVKDFKKPAGIVSATVCSKSGDKPGELCPESDLVTDIFAKGTVPSKICDSHVFVKVCADSNQLPTDRCPNVVDRPFHNSEVPTEYCTIHDGSNAAPGVPVCTDPSHGTVPYKALIPGPNEEGGCPSDLVQYQQFPAGQEPTVPCPISDHQIRPKAPVDTVVPQNPVSQDINSPWVDKPKGPKKPKSW